LVTACAGSKFGLTTLKLKRRKTRIMKKYFLNVYNLKYISYIVRTKPMSMRKQLLSLIALLLFCSYSFGQTGPITGTLSVCQGYTTTLNCTPPGGIWSSSNPSIASIGSSSGVAMGNSAGVVTITYNGGSTGFSVAMLTVNPIPGNIGCPSSGCIVCLGATINVTDPTTGGVWSTQNSSIASVGSSSGVITGVSVGTTVLTYTLMPSGCFVTDPVIVDPNPSAISGPNTVCAGSSITLSATPPIGTAPGSWSCNPVTTATITPTSGVLTGISAGVVSVTYTLPTGCFSVYSVTVNPAPGPIMCPTTSGCSVCVGNTLALTDGVTGGTWSSSNPGIGSIDPSTGVLTGISAGSTIVTYAIGTCITTTTVVVNANPSGITGTLTVCAGATTSLNCTPAGGTWSSSNALVGTVSTGGVVTGIGAGVTTITYTLGSGCYITTNVTVNAAPGPISCAGSTGMCSVCVGSTLTLFISVPGGIWSSSNTSIATVGSLSGIVTGVSAGTVIITYTLPGGCFTTASIPVNTTPAITGGNITICSGSGALLTGSPSGGTWTSGNPAVGTVNTAGTVTGISAGVVTITYMLSSGCYATTSITVNATPVISGGGTVTYSVCVGSTINLFASPTGGVWTCSPGSVATIGSASGIVTGVGTGVANVTYTLGGCTAYTTVTVHPNPGPITGTMVVCTGASTSLSCTPPGGFWSCSPGTVASIGISSGILTGISSGIATVTYSSPAGCYSIAYVTVNATPTIFGSPVTCAGGSATLSASPSGGTWTSSTPAVATVGAISGVVSGITAGTTTIVYTLPSGCSASLTFTVTPAPGPIYCPSTGCQVCVGSTATLTDPIPGGTWSSSNTGIATVGSSTGVVTGVSAGTSYITYTLGGCSVVTLFTVDPSPAQFAITGGGGYCSGGGGVNVGLSGSQLGVNYQLFCGLSPVGPVVAGTGSPITFGPQTGPCVYSIVGTSASGCTTTMSGTTTVSVNPAPLAIVCPITGCSVCAGSSITLTDPTPSGSWSSSNPSVATVSAGSGVVTGVAQGVSVITYTLPDGCTTTQNITVDPAPAAITGPHIICVTNTNLLSDATPGGVWSAGCGNVSVNSASGAVTGVSAGACSSITYTLPGGCYATFPITVDPSPCTNAVSTLPGTDNVNLFPNPATDEVTLKMDDLYFNSLTIANNLGQVLIDKKIAAPETTINVHLLPPGVYFVTLRGENGVLVRRLIKE
jgi:trimeric autotransporter adhesin